MAVKLSSQVKEIQKDFDNIEKHDTYVETVKLRAEVDQLRSQVSALWDYTNKLRDKFNGHWYEQNSRRSQRRRWGYHHALVDTTYFWAGTSDRRRWLGVN